MLASHVHPSVAAMARTLLSGAHIVYFGNPTNDLSLTAFLDKFMEKKPKQSTWHGGSDIEPVKKVDSVNLQLNFTTLDICQCDCDCHVWFLPSLKLISILSDRRFCRWPKPKCLRKTSFSTSSI